MKAKKGKSVGSIHFKLKFRSHERRVDVRQKGRELFTNTKEASVRIEETEGPMTEPRYFLRFIKQSIHRHTPLDKEKEEVEDEDGFKTVAESKKRRSGRPRWV